MNSSSRCNTWLYANGLTKLLLQQYPISCTVHHESSQLRWEKYRHQKTYFLIRLRDNDMQKPVVVIAAADKIQMKTPNKTRFGFQQFITSRHRIQQPDRHYRGTRFEPAFMHDAFYVHNICWYSTDRSISIYAL